MVFHLFVGKAFAGSISMVLIILSLSLFILAIYLEKKFAKMNRNIYYREELFNSLCSNIDDIFLIYHIGNHKIEYISPNTDRTLGISSNNIKKNPFIIFNYSENDLKTEINRIFTKDILLENYETECKLLNPKTHQLVWLILRIYPVLDRQTVIRYIICISDLTKEKQSQQILKDALLNAQKANEAKKEFLSHMSHEIRTPINTVLGMAQIASNYLDNKEKVSDCLNKISVASKNLLTLVNNILDMSKKDSSSLQLTKEPFHICEFLFTFSSIIKTQAELNQQVFELTIDQIQNDFLLGDTLRLNQILLNCVSNALKFTPTGGNIKLEVSEIEKHGNKALFRFTISDNGIGMSKEFIEKIFIPFEQEEFIAKKYGGSGLGMPITKNLVTLMGGNIYVTSKLNFGTTITIDIVFEIAKPDTEIDEDAKNISKKLKYDFSEYRILIVEDNDINLEIICEILKPSKITIDTASDGLEALEKFKNCNASYYNIILMDLQMPKMNGYETAKAIRELNHPDSKKICIVAMSADSFAKEADIAIESNINYHITKPVETEDLFSLLYKIIIDPAYPII
ncbi:response regulator [Mobilitalea sibirica]|uniref:Stage 0 sporulation protein A homolog n=1 Tax=Mobilitalea sibirica TaxID=1462919 RepID=A0A8J7HDR6_9FIRM|nr:ATP-binding protein [Mobilitalea sibirica]MBH1942397.1 response regulator [Mobilitalea sibirica]